MAFFSRPNLDNTQFKQLQGGEPLTLSGQTQIATTTGLTLIGDGGIYIPVIATGASNNFVLTYDSTQQAIMLKQSSASGATGIYPYDESSTCTVGGLDAGSCLYNEQVVDILHNILVPNVEPILVSQSASFSITPTALLYEVGTPIILTGCACFDSGCIDPLYSSGGSVCVGRSCGASGYSFNIFGPATGVTYTSSPSVSCVFPSHDVTAGNNTVSAIVYYSGGTQPYYSDCTTIYSTPLSAGCETPAAQTISGIYPWYWGTVTCAAAAGVGRPDKDCIKHEITGGTANKEVETSDSTICVTFGSTGSDYIWFAIPSCGGCEKTCWYIDALNNQPITGPVSAGGCLFPAYNASTDLITGATSAQGCWSIPQDYEMYVSNYQSAASVNMQLRNS